MTTAKTTKVKLITKLQLLNRLSRFAVECDKKGFNIDITQWSHYHNERRNEVGIHVTKYKGDNYDFFSYTYFPLPMYNVEVEAKLAYVTEKIKKYESK